MQKRHSELVLCYQDKYNRFFTKYIHWRKPMHIEIMNLIDTVRVFHKSSPLAVTNTAVIYRHCRCHHHHHHWKTAESKALAAVITHQESVRKQKSKSIHLPSHCDSWLIVLCFKCMNWGEDKQNREVTRRGFGERGKTRQFSLRRWRLDMRVCMWIGR